MEHIKLSVLILVYNQQELVKRAIASIPKRDDVEIVIVNDASTDDTETTVVNCGRDVKLYSNPYNMGVGESESIGRSLCKGEWTVRLDSDDYFLPNINDFIDKYLIDDYDVVYYDLEINNGHKFDRSTKDRWCRGNCKFIRTDFIKGIGFTEQRAGEDEWLDYRMWDRHPRACFTETNLVHYNWPREGSVSWYARR